MPFKPGQSGNPRGRPRLVGEAREFSKQKRRELQRKRWRDSKIEARYGLTKESARIIRADNNSCWCCGSNTPGKEGSNVAWNVDHDHKTGELRGLLCIHCNLFIGNATDGKGNRDNLESLEVAYTNARKYLLEGRARLKQLLEGTNAETLPR